MCVYCSWNWASHRFPFFLNIFFLTPLRIGEEHDFFWVGFWFYINESWVWYTRRKMRKGSWYVRRCSSGGVQLVPSRRNVWRGPRDSLELSVTARRSRGKGNPICCAGAARCRTWGCRWSRRRRACFAFHRCCRRETGTFLGRWRLAPACYFFS